MSFKWLTLGNTRALQVPKSPVCLCLLDRIGCRHLPGVVAAAIGAARPSVPEAWLRDSSLASASVGAARQCLISL